MPTAPTDDTPAKGERILLTLLAAVQFTHIIDFMIMMPLGPKLQASFGIREAEFTNIVGAYSLAAGIMGFIAGFFLDRFDRKKSLLTLYAGFLLGTFCCAVAPTYPLLVLARFVAGGFGGVAGAVILAIIGDAIPESRRGRAMGVIMTAFSLATILGVPAGLVLAEKFQWHAPFVMIVAIGIPVLLLAWKTLPSLPPHPRDTAHGELKRMRVILTHADHLRAFALMVVITAAGALIFPLLSTFYVKNTGFAENKLWMLYAVGGATTLVTSPIIGKLADKYGKARTFYVLVLASTVPTLITTHLGQTPIALTIAASTLFMVLSSGRFVPTMALITMSVEPKYRGGFMSVNSSVQQIALAAATVLGGYIVHEGADGTLHGYDLVGWLPVALLLGCFPLGKRLNNAIERRKQAV